jgi:hypothetical protein
MGNLVSRVAGQINQRQSQLNPNVTPSFNSIVAGFRNILSPEESAPQQPEQLAQQQPIENNPYAARIGNVPNVQTMPSVVDPQLEAQRMAMQTNPGLNTPYAVSPNVNNVIQQLMAERQANEQAMIAPPVQPMQQQMPSFQQQQVLPFNFPQRYNYFFGPSPFAQSFQSMQQPYGQQFGGFGRQGLFSQLSPFLSAIRNRIY